ncbi:class A beta-lactamase-related serine hydrolase [bacterium]|nr:class A beta-lactamase-related serine hydrolase [bacterium]
MIRQQKSKTLWWILGGLGVFFLLSSLLITVVEYRRFEGQTADVFPAGSTVAALPVGGLDASQAEARVVEFYTTPLTLRIGDATMQAAPADLGFQFDPAGLVQAGLSQVESGRFWPLLWQQAQAAPPVTVTLDADVNQTQLTAYLESEIAPRYTQPGASLAPIPFTTNFSLSSSGQSLDIEQSAADITAELLSPETHTVTLTVTTTGGDDAPNWDTLEAFLRHNIEWTEFDGLVEVRLQSMATGQTLHFAVWEGETVTPDIAFTGFSAIKVPIMISLMRRLDLPVADTVENLMIEMVVNSENAAADTLMEYIIDEDRGPLLVTDDMQALGLENTFLSGFFYPGAPVLELIETPANTRSDIDLDPDVYNQLIVAEMGTLLTGIYDCAADGSGLLIDSFPGDLSAEKCQYIIEILSLAKPLQFIDTTLPPEAEIANKYGYGLDADGVLRTTTDNAIVFTPGGDYVLDIAVYDPDWLYVAEGQWVIGRLSQTVYNFFNPENQAYWWFD